ncbi:hypothetical protein L7F22_000696 [Adiantum nelumboides]|nr:hypothetical protein [Adiantum nelumboides]
MAVSFPTFYGCHDENARDFMDSLEMAHLMVERDQEEVKLRAFPLVLKGEARVWYDALAPSSKATWPTLYGALLNKIPKKKKEKVVKSIKSNTPINIEPIVDAYIKGKRFSNVYVDGGAQMWVITKRTMHSLGLCITEPSDCHAKLANNSKVKCLGTIKDVHIIVLDVFAKVDFYVMPSKGEGYPFILGRPWLMKVNADQKWGSGKFVLQKGKRIVYDMKLGKQSNICFETSIDKESESDESSYGDEESYTSEESSMEVMGLVFQQPKAKGLSTSKEVELKVQKEPMLEERLRKMLAKDLTKEEEENYINMFKRQRNKEAGGFVILNEEKREVFKKGIHLHLAHSNNEVEYATLKAGLEECKSMEIKRLMVKGDALLIVRHVQGTWACKNSKLLQWLHEVKLLIKDFEAIQIQHISRQHNKEVDTIANTQFENLEKVQRHRLVRKALTYHLIGEHLYHKGKDLVLRRVPLVQEIEKNLMSCHDGVCGGHFAQEITSKKILQAGFVWPSLHRDVQHWCRACKACQQAGDCKLSYGPRFPIFAYDPFEKWGIDAIGPLPRTSTGKQYILTATDYMTRWAEAASVARITAANMRKLVLDYICSRFGTPLEIVFNRGPGFRADLLNALLENLSIKHVHSTPYYPQCNDLVKKTNGVLCKIITKHIRDRPQD